MRVPKEFGRGGTGWEGKGSGRSHTSATAARRGFLLDAVSQMYRKTSRKAAARGDRVESRSTSLASISHTSSVAQC